MSAIPSRYILGGLFGGFDGFAKVRSHGPPVMVNIRRPSSFRIGCQVRRRAAVKHVSNRLLYVLNCDMVLSKTVISLGEFEGY